MIKGSQKLETGVKFSKESYEINDKWGISLIVEKLRENGWTVDNKLKEDYDVDISARVLDYREFFEVEVKTGYKFTCMEDFPFDTVSFLARKQKWAKRGFYYVIVCRETEAFLCIHSSDIYKAEYHEKIQIDTEHRKGADSFYRVPKELCTFNKLPNMQL